jgi:cytidylate kinase
MVLSGRGVAGLEHLHQYLEADRLEGEGRRAAPAGPPPITIALSRQAGSRGAELARIVGARLGWPVYDRELLDRIAQEKGLSTRLVESLDERHIGWLEEFVRAFVSEGGREGAYQRGLLEILASLSKAGHCVVVGRGAAQALPAEKTLSVRVVAPRDFRIAEVQRRDGLSADQAERWVDARDRERLAFVKGHFGTDPDDPVRYDLILNSARMSVEDAAALIVQAARALEARLAASEGGRMKDEG